MRRIVLGVTGSIAAYKACELVRLFVKRGDSVQVVMTPAACEFVRPLTFQTLSRNPVAVEQFAPPVAWRPEHIALAEAADLMVVAPATANTIAKLRYGIADNLLTAVALAVRGRMVVAPAMNTAMWEAPATRENLVELRRRGVCIVEPSAGELACGASGGGRLAELAQIVEACS